MNIAVNTVSLFDSRPAGFEHSIFDRVSRLALQFPQHQFIYIFSGHFDQKFITSENIKALRVKPSLLWQYWYTIKLPVALKKINADILLNMTGICSSNTKIPQCIWVPENALVQESFFTSKKLIRFYKRHLSRFMMQACTILTPSEYVKSALIEKLKIAETKINVILPAINKNFRIIDEPGKEKVKQEYTGGKEYFLFSGALHPANNLMNLLKAFSVFKKRQKSNMQLLIAGEPGAGHDILLKSLQTFKYRDDVKLTSQLKEQALARVFAAAYAFVYPTMSGEFVMHPLEAMHCGVPVITSNKGSLSERCGNAAMYCDPASFTDIAEKMMDLFKDENKKKEMVEKGFEQVKRFNPEQAAEQLWQSLLKCTGPVN